MPLERFTNRDCVTASGDQTAADLARLMRDRHVGAVIIIDGGRPVGIVTDRDLVIRVLAEDWSPSCRAAEIMTRDLSVVSVDAPLDHVLNLMRTHGIRRVPIVGADHALVGVITMDDLLVLLGGEVSSVAETVLDNRGP